MLEVSEARYRARQLLDSARVTHVPVNVHALAQLLGFDVIPFPFPPTIHGVTFIEGDVRSIGVNQHQPVTRQRFSIAHEIGHFLSGHISFDDEELHVEESQGWFDPYNRQEREANQFAAELLMPSEYLHGDVTQYGLDAPRLAKRYQVSEQAMWIQLIDLELASQYAKV